MVFLTATATACCWIRSSFVPLGFLYTHRHYFDLTINNCSCERENLCYQWYEKLPKWTNSVQTHTHTCAHTHTHTHTHTHYLGTREKAICWCQSGVREYKRKKGRDGECWWHKLDAERAHERGTSVWQINFASINLQCRLTDRLVSERILYYHYCYYFPSQDSRKSVLASIF